MRYHFQGRLTARDCKRHLPHRFAVPEGTAQIELLLHFAPAGAQGIKNLLTLTLFDPEGFRGAGHRGGDTHQVRLSATEATPGYLLGPLPAGEWIAQLDTHMIMPGEPIHYELEVVCTPSNAKSQVCSSNCSRSSDLQVTEIATIPARAPHPRWYRGDLHTHTHHSDANGRSVAELLQSARDVGLDFIFLTDHNTNSGLAEAYASSTNDLYVAGGIELTTYWGHALCLGAHDWLDWRMRPNSGEMARLAEHVNDSGQLFIIAHPQSFGDPYCTGCTWRFGEMMPGNARLVEVWNGPWQGDSNNEAALWLWYDWLNEGLRLVATAGTDTHSTRDYGVHPGFNLVYTEELSEAALLRALRSGHVVLSAGPQLTLEAQSDDGTRWMVGDQVSEPVTCTARWRECPPDARLRVMINGRALAQEKIGSAGERSWRVSPEEADWLVVEIREGDRELLAVTNPLFFVS